MKTMIVTTPIRPAPTSFPPFGSLALMHYLRKNGVDDIEFYNIDGNRPDYQTALDHIREARPDVIGISAVVSTAYEYCRRLSLDVKEMLPECLIVLGGNMGASANVLLRRTGVDLVVLGEGEQIFLDVVRRAAHTRNPLEFADIAGLTLLDAEGNLVNTGYAPVLDKSEVYEIDWNDLETSSDIGIYFPVGDAENVINDDMSEDPRYAEPHRRGKTIGSLYASKGCVSRCTFCHRWDKGIRFIPVPIVMQRLDEIIERYNVGFLHLADENFGTDRRWLAEFCAEIKKRDILWRMGTRAKGITPESIAMLKDSGCTSVVYGNETGSKRMLEVMEKKVSIEDNYNAVKWAIEAGLDSKVQLVCGMPGESPETIRETIEFCQFTNSLSPNQNPNDLSINYAQALPGTPLYEYGRAKGLIGNDLDGEEKYLLAISDRDAHDEYTTLNFTDYPKLICETWRPLITVEVNHHYVRKYGFDHYKRVLLKDAAYFESVTGDSGYFANPRRLVESAGAEAREVDDAASDIRLPSLWKLVSRGHWGMALICHPEVAYRFRSLLIFLVILKNLKEYGLGRTGRLVGEYLRYRLNFLSRIRHFNHDYKSLRKVVDSDIGALPGDEMAMAALRRGR